MGTGGKRGLYGAALALALTLLGPSAAIADDANSVPPRIHLWASGEQEGLLGPRGKGNGYNGSVAYFETEAPDQSWEYAKGSNVTFACFLDGQPTSCKAEQVLCCAEIMPLPSKLMAREEAPRPRDGYGAFNGEVAAPANLASGWHTVSVVATDEDGTDPSPPTARLFLDREAPSAPRLIKAPARVSRDHKPRFRYFSTDDKGFPTRTYTSTELFKARLRRLRPPGPLLGKGSPFGTYLEWRGPFCPTPRRCTETDFAAYSASAGHGSYFGVPERLNPGLYEFTVKAFDAVGNRSPLTRYRFRVLP